MTRRPLSGSDHFVMLRPGVYLRLIAGVRCIGVTRLILVFVLLLTSCAGNPAAREQLSAVGSVGLGP